MLVKIQKRQRFLLRNPEDISVIGLDDAQYNQDVSPIITTFHYQKNEAGMLAGYAISKMLRGQPAKSRSAKKGEHDEN